MAGREHILFLTGRLAYNALCRELAAIPDRPFDYTVHDLGLSVAALMTTAMVRRRLTDTRGADRILVPGLCSGPAAELDQHFGIPVTKGPKDLKDLPEYFGRRGTPPDLGQYRIHIFAEIVDAPQLAIPAILDRAAAYQADGADVIDLGCLPETSFPHLEEAVQSLTAAGYRVSVDSMDSNELLRGARAGADYLLSLKESTLWIADEVPATPVLIPESSGDLDSLVRAAEALLARGRKALLDPILDPIHFGLTDSIVRYHTLRQRLPDASIMMGTGNVTELTDADTTGITAVLLGIGSELQIDAILTTQVSSHARSAVREADRARRMLHAAWRDNRLPRDIDGGLLALHERKPFPYTAEEIAERAAAIRDPSFRIELSAEGVHIYNRDSRRQAIDPFDLFPHLGVENDGAHAFYLGVELAKAQIAWQLGKRYFQDRQLNWGCVVTQPDGDRDDYAPAGSTLQAQRSRHSG